MSFPLCGEDLAASTFDLPALKMNAFDFPFTSVWHLSNTSAQFHFFQGVPLYTACVCAPAIILKCGKVTGPTNSQTLTELKFGNTTNSFRLACKSHFLNQNFPYKVLTKTVFRWWHSPIQEASHRQQGWKHAQGTFFLFSHLSQSEKKAHRLENSTSSESSNSVYQVSVQIIAVKMFNLLAMKMLSWHWFWSYMLLNISWCFCSWAIVWNARACSEAGWDESLQGACVNTAVKKAASSHRL